MIERTHHSRRILQSFQYSQAGRRELECHSHKNQTNEAITGATQQVHTIIPIDTITAIMAQGNNYEPDNQDVLLGRGGATNNHEGNKRFRAVVASHQEQYLASKKKDKAIISRSIVGIIQSNGGRFLRKNPVTDAWETVDDKKAVEKTSQALREGLNVRRTTTKSPRHNSESSVENEDPSAKRHKVGKTVSWDESFPSLKEYDAGEATTIPELEDEILGFHPPSISRENCEYIASV